MKALIFAIVGFTLLTSSLALGRPVHRTAETWVDLPSLPLPPKEGTTSGQSSQGSYLTSVMKALEVNLSGVKPPQVTMPTVDFGGLMPKIETPSKTSPSAPTQSQGQESSGGGGGSGENPKGEEPKGQEQPQPVVNVFTSSNVDKMALLKMLLQNNGQLTAEELIKIREIIREKEDESKKQDSEKKSDDEA